MRKLVFSVFNLSNLIGWINHSWANFWEILCYHSMDCLGYLLYCKAAGYLLRQVQVETYLKTNGGNRDILKCESCCELAWTVWNVVNFYINTIWSLCDNLEYLATVFAILNSETWWKIGEINWLNYTIGQWNLSL